MSDYEPLSIAPIALAQRLREAVDVRRQLARPLFLQGWDPHRDQMENFPSTPLNWCRDVQEWPITKNERMSTRTSSRDEQPSVTTAQPDRLFGQHAGGLARPAQ